jgi:hypothetical protein
MMMDTNTTQYKDVNRNRANVFAKHNAMLLPNTARENIAKNYIMEHVEDVPS